MRLLVIEDNRHLNYELKMSLLDEGYAVDAAFDGEGGQALAEMTSYDVIIDAVLCVADLTLDPAMHTVERATQRIELTARLFSVLEYLMRHPNQVLTREMIAIHIWSYDFTGTLNAVEVCIRRLRNQVDDPFEDKLIETIRGVGYRLRTLDSR